MNSLFKKDTLAAAGALSRAPTVLPERNLDILRSIAVLCVLTDHLLSAWNLQLPLDGSWALGRLGVLFFFVHTALVLMSSLERQGTAERGWVGGFYLRRGFRIYPVAIVTVLFVAISGMPEHVVQPQSAPVAMTARTLVANLTLTQNLTYDRNVLAVLWSLPLEVQMYLLLPICFLIARSRSRNVTALIAALVVLGLIVGYVPLPGLGRLSVFSFGPCFAGGVLAYHLGRRGIKPTLPSWLWPLVIAGCAVVFLALSPSADRPETGWIPCVLLGVCIPFVKDGAHTLVTRAAHRLCEVSYGVYLFHVPALWIAFVVLRKEPIAVRWLVLLGLLTLIPTIAYRVIERPGIRLGKNVAKKWMARRLGVHAS